jgi:hypothetical protein
MSKGANKKNQNPISAWKNKNVKYITYDISAKKKLGIWKRLANYIFQHQIGRFQYVSL